MTIDSRIVVVGSVNMDIAARCPHIPVPGETILGTELLESPGGKGGNQAAAAGTLGGDVAMVACLGADAYGQRLRIALSEAGVCVEAMTERGPRSGVAIIEVAEAGENSIVVVQGANALLLPEDVEAALDRMPEARILLLQLEIPLASVTAAARLARARGMRVILDPAPAQPLAEDLLRQVDVLTPNQTEAALLAGMPEVSADTAREAAARLLALGPAAVLVKLGAHGVLVADGGSMTMVRGHRVATVDTTAAGDCFAGALAVALMQDRPLLDAVAFANAAAALSTTRVGAQASMPSRAEVDGLLKPPR